MKKKICSILISSSLIVGGLLCNTQSARADLFGIVDGVNASETAALLAQQILQFGQDALMGADNFSNFLSIISDIDKKADDAKRVANTLCKGTQALKEIDKIYRCQKRITRFARQCDSYNRYLSNFGSNFNVRRVGYITQNFNRRTMSIMNSAEDLFRTISKLGNASGSEMLNAISKVVDETSVAICAEEEEANGAIATVIQEAHFYKNAKANGRVQKQVFI